MRRHFLCGPAGAFWLPLVGAAVGHAQPATDIAPQNRDFMERLALGRARAQLLQELWVLPLKPNVTVGAWISQEVAPDRALRLWCRTLPRHLDARHYSDATCDVDIRLAPEVLKTRLLALRRAHSVLQTRITEEELSAAAGGWPLLWSTGSSALTECGQTRRPDGWEDVTDEGVQVTCRAAAADANYALLEAAGRLKLTAARRLSEFLDASDVVEEAVYEALCDRATVRVECAPDQVAVAEARIGIKDLIRIVTEAHEQHYTGDAFQAADFREMALLIEQDELRADGLAVPPSGFVKPPAFRRMEWNAPSWTSETLSATGRFDPPDAGEYAEFVRAELARFDGIDHVRQDVDALVIVPGVTVAEFLGRHPELKGDVALFFSAARVVDQPHALSDGGVESRVELPLDRLWYIVRGGLGTVDVDPAGRGEETAVPLPEDSP